MKVHYSSDCPGWVKRLIDASIVLMGEDPIAIGRAMACMASPNPSQNWIEKIKNHSLLFKSHNLVVNYGRNDVPWMTILPNGGTLGRDELVKLHY